MQYREKSFLETLRCTCINRQNFISIEVAVQELGGGFTQPLPLGQGVGEKHLGRARIKFVSVECCVNFFLSQGIILQLSNFPTPTQTNNKLVLLPVDFPTQIP